MSTETTLWNWLKNARKEANSKNETHLLHINRVENILVSGMPDVELCHKGQQIWVELKVKAFPKRANTPIKIRFEPAQRPWIGRRTKAQGCAFVLLQLGKYPNRHFCIMSHKKSEYLEKGILLADLKKISDIYIENRISALELINKMRFLCLKSNS